MRFNWRMFLDTGHRVSRWPVFLCLVLCLHGAIIAQEMIYPERTPEERGQKLRNEPWIETIAREVPKLKHVPVQRMPMIMWHGVGFQPLNPQQANVLRERGLTQHLQLDVSHIPAALALQRTNMPVILMQGRTDSWPYSLSENSNEWAHQFDSTYAPTWFGKEDAFEWHGACPNQMAGWRILEEQTREKMRAFRDAGVNLSGVWMDFEGDPYPWPHLFDQMQHCRRCRSAMPSRIINDKEAWRNYAWSQYVDLYDRYFAKPIREAYPDCLVTNWHVVFSSKQKPIRYFTRDLNLPVLSPKHFNATNPIAYGCDLTWHSMPGDHKNATTARQVDAFYANEIAQQVRTDRENRLAAGNHAVRAVPWVARYCRIDAQNRKTPIMSRGSYRSSLHKLWKQDIATMQIFNPMHDGYEEYALLELQDAVAAYDASLSPKPAPADQE